MKQLQVIEKNEQRVLTTSQLSEVYGADYKSISKNFTRNKPRYTEGKHYFILSGQDLKDFKTNHQIDDQSKHSPIIYLWTAKGALMHAKSLGTDEAWEKYEILVDDYFKKVEKIKESQQPQQDISSASPQLQYLFMMEQRQMAIESKQTTLEAKLTLQESNQKEVKEAVTTLTDNMTAAPDHTKVVSTINEYARWTRLGHNEVYNKVYDLLKSAHGIDVRQRVQNERDKLQKDYNTKTGKYYSDSTLKAKVNGMDVMVRLGCLDKFHSILAGMLAKEKMRSQLSLVQ